MTKETIDEREFELINIIGAELGSNQRDLSRLLDLSLGQTNMLVKRLVSKGLIRISQLNKKKVKYLLTPKGFSEKMQKSIKYTLKTIHSISALKNSIKDNVSRLYNEGQRKFYVLGRSDFAILIEMVFGELGLEDYSIEYLDELPTEKLNGALLICKEGINNGHELSDSYVDLLHELAKDHYMMGHIDG